MQSEIKKVNNIECLVVTIPTQAPTLSATGKTKVVASSGGGQSTTAVIDGKAVTVNITAWIKP